MSPDKLDEVLAKFNQGMDAIPGVPVEPEAEAAEQAAHGLRTFRDEIRSQAAYAVQNEPGSLVASFSASLINGITQGLDETTLQILLDSLLSGQIDLELAKRAHLVEICLPNLRADFNRGLRLIGSDRSVSPQPKELTFEQIEDALLANNAFGLTKAAAMQGGGELFGLDENKKFLFKDRGNEPVMFGFDKNKKPVTVYNRNAAQMAQIKNYANYYQIYEAVYGPEDAPTGYELFPDAPDYQKTGMLAAVEQITGAPFVRSANGNEYRSSWLNNGRNPDKFANARYVDFNPDGGDTYVYNGYPNGEGNDRGASRLLRV